METKPRTYRDISRFITVATNWLQGEERELYLEYAITRVLKSAKKKDEDLQEEMNRVNIEHASTDDKGKNLVTGLGGSLIYTKENILKRNAEIRELQDQEVQVGFYMAKPIKDKDGKVIPFKLNGLEREVFEGFVIPEMEEPKDDEPAVAP